MNLDRVVAARTERGGAGRRGGTAYQLLVRTTEVDPDALAEKLGVAADGKACCSPCPAGATT
ncbi:hypothetical protein [Nonomuraea sp. NPDC005501]|uniref:hypothetical protein n=1 Tax=Nonomuraea sp. NPDC005501 TaxID=3156884 RepID=UPI00339FB939